MLKHTSWLFVMVTAGLAIGCGDDGGASGTGPGGSTGPGDSTDPGASDSTTAATTPTTTADPTTAGPTADPSDGTTTNTTATTASTHDHTSGSSGDVTASTSGGSTGVVPGGVTFYEDVAPIIFASCVGCHRAGGVGPFPLTNYAEAKPLGPLMAQVTAERHMPPNIIDASGSCNTFKDVLWLGDAEIQTIQQWVDDGLQEGDPNNAPPLPPPPGGLAQVAATVDMGAAYVPKPGDEYRCFVVDPKLAKQKFLTGYDVKPGDPTIVHHMLMYMPLDANAQAAAEQKDANAQGLGYPCFGFAGVPAQLVVAWAPGSPPTMYPEGTGIPIPAGRKLIMQMHYNSPGGKSDQTKIDLAMADAVASPAQMYSVSDNSLSIPPGEAAWVEMNQQKIPAQIPFGKIWGTFPHMHLLGRKQKVTLNGACVVDASHYMFHWQRMYFHEQPIAFKANDVLQITCTYESLDQNQTVKHGEGTADEMCLNILYVSL